MLALALAAVVIGVKAVLLPFPVTTLGELVRWLLRLAIVASPDLAFVVGVWLACALVGAMLGCRPRALAIWRGAVYALFCLAALYAVASVPMYWVLKTPVTIRLISFAGGPRMMASSIQPFMPPGIWGALIAAPLAVVAAPRLVRRLPALRQVAWRSSAVLQSGRAVTAVVVLASLYGTVCHAYIASHWTDPNRWERRIARSPHVMLLASCVEELCKDQAFALSLDVEETDESDFREVPRAADGGRDANPSRLTLAPDQRPRNVVLILLESVGFEYFGLTGSRYPTTPHLDEWARRQGMVFENLYVQATSSCKSLVTLSASTYPRPDWLLVVRDHPAFDVPTIAEVLGERGYRTCYAHSGYWAWKGRDRFLRARGVEQLIDAADRPDEQVNSWGIHDHTMYQDVLNWIDAGAGRPFFVLAYTIETHHPYVAPEVMYDFGVEDEEYNRYLNSVRAADAKLDWFLQQLHRRGLTDSTLVAITSDHGESFGQHGQKVHSFGLYEPEVHVPLVLLHPSLRDGPRKLSTVGQHLDIAPTLLDLLGIDPPQIWQGESLLSARRRSRAYFFAVGNEVVLGLRDGRFKYHYYVDSRREELFDLDCDPGELRSVASEQAERCDEYRRRVAGLVHFQRRHLARHGVR